MDEGTAGSEGDEVNLISVHPLLGGVISPPAEPVLCTLFTVHVYTVHSHLDPLLHSPELTSPAILSCAFLLVLMLLINFLSRV